MDAERRWPGRLAGALRVRGAAWLPRARRSALARGAAYLVAVALVGATLLVRLQLGGALEGRAVTTIFIPPILVAAFFGGLGPGVLATAGAALGAQYFLMAPAGAFAIARTEHRVQFALLAVSGLAISAVVEALHRTRWKLEERTASVVASEARLQVVVRTSGEGITMRGADGRLIVANPAAERLLGRVGDELDGAVPNGGGWFTLREDGSVLPESERPSRKVLVTGEGLSNGVVGIHRPDGTVTWLSVNSQPFFEPGAAAPAAVVTTYADITAQREQAARRRELEEQLHESRKLESIGRLAGGVAHDFNNLLTVILSCAEVLSDGEVGATPAQRDAVQDIRDAGARAAELTRQLLAFARRQVISPVPLDVNEVVRGSEKLMRRVLGEDVRLAVSLAPALWRVRCDPGQLEQVILNLATNARDAMPKGGTLTLATANVDSEAAAAAKGPALQPGPHVRLSVTDSGQGMSPEALAHVFEPFFTTKPRGRGTGLGLATVYGVVKQSGGAIRVASAPGQGTTFDIYLPRTLELPAPSPEPPGPAEALGGRETVLLLEDEPQVREVIARLLRAGGYHVLTARDGAEALAQAEAAGRRLDLLVSDVVMPGRDGPSVAADLRRRQPGLRVLFVSGYAEEALSKRGVLQPHVALLPKPFTAPTLLRRVREVLDRADAAA